MNFDQHKLMSLLPAFQRLRDGQIAQELGLAAGPLQELLALMAEQIAVIEEDLEQLQDDAFIETCAEWAVPYIGDLIGYRALYGVASRVANARAEVAHTIAYRRRKGTATVLEQLARDVTDWNACAVEFFQRLITTQYMNHRRVWVHAAPDLRNWQALDRVGSAFDAMPRTIDVRRIESGRGRHNIPNIGLFLWPLDAWPLSYSPAARVDDRRWRFSPLNHDQPLVTRPETEDDITHLATPLNVPRPIGRRVLHEDQRKAAAADPQRPVQYYSDGALRRSLRLYVGTTEPLPAVDYKDVCVCNLADDAGSWAHLPPAGKYAIDPVLGRIALPPGLPAGTRVRVDWHYGFGAALGGGEYERAATFAEPASTTPVRVPQDHATIQAAITALGGQGVVEITDSGRYEETLAIDVAASQRIELRARNGHRPTLVLGGEMPLTGGQDGEIVLNGLLICGDRLNVVDDGSNRLRKLTLRHCTLVPGHELNADGSPVSPGDVSLRVEIPDVQTRLERCIVGALRVVEGSESQLLDCIVDATAQERVAYAALDGDAAGGPLTLEACTCIGKLHVLRFVLVSNSILLAEPATGDTWAAPVVAERRQLGCVRYSYVPATARTPRRFRCVPGEDTTDSPVLRFGSLRYGTAIYAQLGQAASRQVRMGADDEGEMGAYHHVHGPQREANLRLRLDEYLRVGLEAGVFYET
ncbi:hypothetical protein ACFPN1_03280 [Lysobacter yangpyeongensis]|uniref:Phage tail protein (Tail_P2_I) n=1 Tax=Lysobacter yangpyeongensis TaxID=346182 RepID=A0ABW0SK39_9GAMM